MSELKQCPFDDNEIADAIEKLIPEIEDFMELYQYQRVALHLAVEHLRRTPVTGNLATPKCFIQAQGYKEYKCLGVAQDGDDEPIEKCKQCPYCTANERRTSPDIGNTIKEPEVSETHHGVKPIEIEVVKNEPLSLEELRGMAWLDWLWIECLAESKGKVSGYYQRHMVGTPERAGKDTFWCGTLGITTGFEYSDYGKTWLAYRQKPEPKEEAE